MAASTRTISPRASSGTRQAGLRHWRELWEAVEASQEHACIQATIPWSRKRAMPKPPELERTTACCRSLRKQRSTFAARLRCACRRSDSATFFFLPRQGAFEPSLERNSPLQSVLPYRVYYSSVPSFRSFNNWDGLSEIHSCCTHQKHSQPGWRWRRDQGSERFSDLPRDCVAMKQPLQPRSHSLGVTGKWKARYTGSN